MSNEDTAVIAALKRRIREKAAQFQEFMSNPVGRKLVQILNEEFDREDLRGATVEETYYNLGARDVVKYLETLSRVQTDPDAILETSE